MDLVVFCSPVKMKQSNRRSQTLVVGVLRGLINLGDGSALSVKIEHGLPHYPAILLQVYA